MAGLLRRLWRQPSPAQRFRPLQVLCDAWADEFEAKVATGRGVLDPGLAREGIALFRALPATADRSVLLLTDLHADNVLAAEREPGWPSTPSPASGIPPDAGDPPKLARPGEREMQTWNPKQLRSFFEGIAGHRLAAAYVLAATTCMRRGEILGLRRSDIDLKAGRLAVTHHPCRSYRITPGTPKTSRGRRSIALDPETVRIPATHRARQTRERLEATAYSDHDLVFARNDGRPVHPDYSSQTFDRTVRRLKLPKIRLHDLRHTLRHSVLRLEYQ